MIRYYARESTINENNRTPCPIKLEVTPASPSWYDTHWQLALTEAGNEMCTAGSREPERHAAAARLCRTVTGLKSVSPTQFMRFSRPKRVMQENAPSVFPYLFFILSALLLHNAYNKIIAHNT